MSDEGRIRRNVSRIDVPSWANGRPSDAGLPCRKPGLEIVERFGSNSAIVGSAAVGPVIVKRANEPRPGSAIVPHHAPKLTCPLLSLMCSAAFAPVPACPPSIVESYRGG